MRLYLKALFEGVIACHAAVELGKTSQNSLAVWCAIVWGSCRVIGIEFIEDLMFLRFHPLGNSIFEYANDFIGLVFFAFDASPGTNVLDRVSPWFNGLISRHGFGVLYSKKGKLDRGRPSTLDK